MKPTYVQLVNLLRGIVAATPADRALLIAQAHELLRLVEPLPAAGLTAPPNCATCRWLRVDSVAPGYEDTAAVCAHESEAHPLHWCRPVGNPETFGCTFHAPTEPTR